LSRWEHMPRQRTSEASRLYVLLVGYEILPKSVSTKNLGGKFIIASPICCYLLETAQGWVLLDTGFDARYARDPALAEKYFHSAGVVPPIVNPEHELFPQLAQLGVGKSDVKHIVLSHLHLDHVGNLKYFTGSKIHIQRQELEHGLSTKRPQSYFLEDYDFPGIDWQLHEGDWQLLPGVDFIKTRGHTPGHQSAVVHLPRSGSYTLPFDAGDFQENFDREILPGETVDDPAALASIQRLKSLTSENHGRMLLFHDPTAIQEYRLAPDFYD
jgi:N-acyl homoserine lactone hydrolase